MLQLQVGDVHTNSALQHPTRRRRTAKKARQLQQGDRIVGGSTEATVTKAGTQGGHTRVMWQAGGRRGVFQVPAETEIPVDEVTKRRGGRGRKKGRGRGRRGGAAARWEEKAHPRGPGGQFVHTGGRAKGPPRLKAGLLGRPLHLDPGDHQSMYGFQRARAQQARRDRPAVDKVGADIQERYGIRRVNLRGLTLKEAQGVERAVARHHRDFPETLARLSSLSTHTPLQFQGQPFIAAVQAKRDRKRGIQARMFVQPSWVGAGQFVSQREGTYTRATNQSPFMSAMHQSKPDRWMDTVITHEFGHVLAVNGEAAYLARRKGKTTGRAPGNMGVMYRVSMFPQNPGLRTAWMNDRTRWIQGDHPTTATRSGSKKHLRPSVYGMTMPGEYFAENFAVARTRPPGVNHNPTVDRWTGWYAAESKRHERTPGVRKALDPASDPTLDELDPIGDVDESDWVWLPGYPAMPMPFEEVVEYTRALNEGRMRRPRPDSLGRRRR